MTAPSNEAIAQAFREAREMASEIMLFSDGYDFIESRARELDAEKGGYVEQLCRECGHATMHMGDLCFFCTKKAKRGPREHKWDRDGERCLYCGDKDWMGGECNGQPRATPPAQAAEAVLDKARMDWLSENFVFADFDYGHDHESILGIQWPKGLAVSAGLRRNVDAAIAAMQGVDRG